MDSRRQSDDMNRICLVVDMDGHSVQKQFYCRELGYAELSTPRRERGSYRFDLRPVAKLMRPEDRKTVYYCENVLGILRLWPYEKEIRDGELLPLESLKTVVKNLWCEFRRPGRVLVGYKGGHVERDLLEELGIPSINLEVFGCPKFIEIEKELAAGERDCGYHHRYGSSSSRGPAHCPQRECAAFAEWMRIALAADDQRIKVEEEEEWWDCI